MLPTAVFVMNLIIQKGNDARNKDRDTLGATLLIKCASDLWRAAEMCYRLSERFEGSKTDDGSSVQMRQRKPTISH